MGVTATIAAGVFIGSTVKQHQMQQEAANEQSKARKEQQAMNAAKAAQERRQQIREERIRRARVIQASENTGTAESSGLLGAQGSLSTQLASNVGFNLGQIRSSNLISNYQQDAQDALDEANMWGKVAQISGSIFMSAAGGMGGGAGGQAPSGAGTQPANISRGGSFSTSN